MPRKLRIEYEGAVYHVMNRGDRREPIFRDDADRKRFLGCMKRAALLLTLLLTLLSGCGHFRSDREKPTAGMGSSQGLYLQSEPHRGLYVEVDAVKGAEPNEAELGKLKAFLQAWCAKPDGITVVTSSVIPRATARGESPLALARRYLDGPPPGSNALGPAFLYILYYDNRIHRNPLHSPRGASQASPRAVVRPELGRPENPHVVLFPYPAMIYIDRSWLGGLLPVKYRQASSVHEAAHLLGLVCRESRVKGLHCATPWCCMSSVSANITSDWVTWLTRGQPHPDLCEACATELRGYQVAPIDPTTRFMGPVLVRSMPEYHVLTLPGACGLYVVDRLEPALAHFMDGFRSRGPNAPDPQKLWFMAHAETEGSSEALLQAVRTAQQDPVPAIARIAVKLEQDLREKIEKRHNGESACQGQP